MKYFFPSNSSGHLRSYVLQSQIIGADADVGHTQTVGGDTVKLLGDISPHPPGFWHPCLAGRSCESLQSARGPARCNTGPAITWLVSVTIYCTIFQ